MSIIDLAKERDRRDGPDADCLRKDDYGRDLLLFALEYNMGGATWALEVWAYSWEDAENRVAAMRESLAISGQIQAIIPA
jgi:hypothetical protein